MNWAVMKTGLCWGSRPPSGDDLNEQCEKQWPLWWFVTKSRPTGIVAVKAERCYSRLFVVQLLISVWLMRANSSGPGKRSIKRCRCLNMGPNCLGFPLLSAVDGHRSPKGTSVHVNHMLTTSHRQNRTTEAGGDLKQIIPHRMPE